MSAGLLRAIAARAGGVRVGAGRASAARALGEGWLLGGALYAGLLTLEGPLPPNLIPQGSLFVSGGAAIWCALRLRAAGAWHRPTTWLREGALAFALSLAVALGWGLAIPAALGRPTPLAGDPGLYIWILLLSVGPQFLAWRMGFALWRYWAGLTRKRLHWAIAETHVQLVLLLALVSSLAFTLLLLSQGYLDPGAEDGAVLATVRGLLWTVLPAWGLLAVLTLMALAVLVPPAALLSYRMARRTTRRLDDLVAAAAAIRAGDYSARTAVRGEDEVARLQEDFNAMAADLERALTSLQAERDRVSQLLADRRELVAKVSHELRTPVATLRGYLETDLRPDRTDLPQAVRRNLAVMENEVLRLQRLIDDLFALSQAHAGGLDLSLAPTDVGALARARVETVAPPAWQQGRVEVGMEAEQEPLWALADPLRLDQVLANLLRNAVQHTPPGGIVSVRVAPDADAVLIEVRDTGEGIAPEDLPRVWERFFRGDGARHHPDGAGLGLALVKELVQAMGGSVGAESSPGEGSRFSVRLPAAGPPEPPETTPPAD